MILHITPGGCADTPKEGSQQVVVQYRRGKDKTFTEYKGCGRFYPDYRLQDIYVVQQIGPTVLDRQKKLPQLAFHLQDSKVLGTTGCNNLDASIKVDGPILHLGMLRTTRKACPDTYEPELLQALTPGAYYYHIAEGLLVLERKGKPMVQLKKID